MNKMIIDKLINASKYEIYLNKQIVQNKYHICINSAKDFTYYIYLIISVQKNHIKYQINNLFDEAIDFTIYINVTDKVINNMSVIKHTIN